MTEVQRTSTERLVNEPIEFEIGTRGSSRTLKLQEPPMMQLVKLLRKETEKLVTVYLEHRKAFDGLVSGDSAGMNLQEIFYLIEPICEEICELAEILDTTEAKSKNKVAEIISANQFLQMVPAILSVLNVEDLRQNFTRTLEMIGIKMAEESPGESGKKDTEK